MILSMAEKTHKPTVSDALREAIRENGKSLYQVAKNSGINYSVLWRFLEGERQLTTVTVDRLCCYLGYKLVKG
ncbi:MAG: helix-turn-helix transcriptional regulator [Planctomycetes bacterium]|nr:helix-turn-helix transcriptional regulator [Planctomycetota bacterium]